MRITVSALHIYPVKALAGIALESCEVSSRGLDDDRRFMLVDTQGEFLTQREHPILATVWTDLVGDELRLSVADRDEVSVPRKPDHGVKLKVRVWDDIVDALAVSNEANTLFSDLLGLHCRRVPPVVSLSR